MPESSAPGWTLRRVTPEAQPAAMVGAWILAEVKNLDLLLIEPDVLILAVRDGRAASPAPRIAEILRQDQFAGWELSLGSGPAP
jgi:hypothetical protein